MICKEDLEELLVSKGCVWTSSLADMILEMLEEEYKKGQEEAMMKIEVTKKVVKEIEEVQTMEVIKYWVIRIVERRKNGDYSVIGERQCAFEPDEQVIGSVLASVAQDKKDIFATIVCNYRLEKLENETLELPF